jgi:hypothetical protein
MPPNAPVVIVGVVDAAKSLVIECAAPGKPAEIRKPLEENPASA